MRTSALCGGVLLGVLGVALVLPAAPASPTTSPQPSQLALTAGACEEAVKAEHELDVTYAALEVVFKHDERAQSRLRQAQAAWLTFRDAQLTFLHPPAAPGDVRGSVEPMCACIAKRDVTLARVQQLNAVLNASEGDVCARGRP